MDIELNCPVCHQPLTHSNEYGTYCDNECLLEDDMALAPLMMPWMEAMSKVVDEGASGEELQSKLFALPESQAVEEKCREIREKHGFIEP